MKKVLMSVLTIIILIGGSLYFKNQSSYSEYASMQDDKTISGKLITADNNPKGVKTENESRHNEESTEDTPPNDERTPEDIALDKRLDEQRKENERTYREEGRKGSSIRPTIEIPSLSIEDIIGIYKTVDAYMRKNPDRFPEPADDGTRGSTDDPRIQNILYAKEKSGIIAGYENENLVAWEVKKLDGEYTNLLLGRKSAGEEWQVLSEGDVYQLRKEMSDGN
ncbi:hypothetical protein G9G63_26330 [Paenibacillus sp. EKM202P]|uniref:hypothetical protein n=1 Tax=unclassified Paenibacillus TaxID=185978 RepID=UPI0013ECD908|nr:MULTISPECIES: hypothetical protein [unclassified Paenibacillus]KAF6557423.1 hypothetical protein G9G63_26330 [Paenibacillus sp. EKM202P]KAF6562936.1 hypothetical protein G9G64_26290 [Paenibacillus sp. EKM207P]